MTLREKLAAAVGAFLVSATMLALVGCGESPAAPEASPSPIASPTPEPSQLAVIVRVTAVQSGTKGVTTVQHNDEFKLNGTATACFWLSVGAPPEATECPIIPRWSQRVIGGFGADCRPQGSLESDSVQWYCTQPGNPTFEVCAYDFDGTQLGCDIWAIEVQ
jgi:hypothetical protein